MSAPNEYRANATRSDTPTARSTGYDVQVFVPFAAGYSAPGWHLVGSTDLIDRVPRVNHIAAAIMAAETRGFEEGHKVGRTLTEDDRLGAARRAAQLRNTYRAEGARAFALMLAEGLDKIADEDGSVSGADAVEFIYEQLTKAGAVTTCDECANDHATSAEVCPFCEDDEPEDELHDLGRCTCETCDEDRYETNYGGPRK